MYCSTRGRRITLSCPASRVGRVHQGADMNVHAKESRRTHLRVEPLEARDVPSAWGLSTSPQANSQVSGMVYADQNADGHAQNWERRLQGVLVVLTGSDAAGPPGNQ